MRLCRVLAIAVCALTCVILAPGRALAQKSTPETCPLRPAPGSVVREPEDLSSRNGVLRVDFTYHNFLDADGQMRYCYVYKDGSEAPTLRLKPGDLLILHLKNDVHVAAPAPGSMGRGGAMARMRGECTGSGMTPTSTNMHFHGLTVPPVCHEDDVLNTFVQPGEPAFRVSIPDPA